MGPRPVGRGNITIGELLQEPYFLLQWGHVLSDVETTQILSSKPVFHHASMGPRPVGRGNNSATVEFQHPTKSFNGATSCRTWKPHWGETSYTNYYNP